MFRSLILLMVVCRVVGAEAASHIQQHHLPDQMFLQSASRMAGGAERFKAVAGVVSNDDKVILNIETPYQKDAAPHQYLPDVGVFDIQTEQFSAIRNNGAEKCRRAFATITLPNGDYLVAALSMVMRKLNRSSDSYCSSIDS